MNYHARDYSYHAPDEPKNRHLSAAMFGQEKTRGYLDGWEADCAELPSYNDDLCASFRLGWNLGRDDRLGLIPASDEAKFLRSELALAADMSPGAE